MATWIMTMKTSKYGDDIWRFCVTSCAFRVENNKDRDIHLQPAQVMFSFVLKKSLDCHTNSAFLFRLDSRTAVY